MRDIVDTKTRQDMKNKAQNSQLSSRRDKRNMNSRGRGHVLDVQQVSAKLRDWKHSEYIVWL